MESKTPGFVLKKQNFGEADRILRIFSAEFGLISVLAKGVKKTKSRKAGSLELFGETNFRLHRRGGELFLVTETNPISAFESKDLAVLQIAFAAGELLLQLAPPEKPLPKVYKIFQDFVTLLPIVNPRDISGVNSVIKPKLQLLKIAFFAKVLAILGFLPQLEQFKIREQKLFKFLLENDFPRILQLENDAQLFTWAEKFLVQLLENSAEKTSRVAAATQNWVKSG
ncbi:MAG: DNA repair protein RecO [Patescibacteria group bacterium]